MTFKEEMKERTEVIEKLLVKYMPKAEGYQSQIMEAMEYSVMAGGKRLRPMLMQETYRLFGGEGKEIEPFMAAMEMIHTIPWCTMICRHWTMTSTVEEERQRILYTGKQWEFLPGMHF